jgi:cysteine desulfurase
MAQGIYLDNSMTTRPSEHAISAMLPFLTDKWGTPSAPHMQGQEVLPAMEDSLKAIYRLLDAKDKDDFVFTSSGPEAVNHVVMSVFSDVTSMTGKNQFITSMIDEAPSIMAIGRLEKWGAVGKMVKPDAEGKITANIIADAITPRTALVSLSWANGLTGVINPIKSIADLCKERGILFHLDATHILGKLFFEMEDVDAHFITFNGDHIHAPKGTGGLWIRSGTKCSPFIVGGIEQAGHRAGSVNVPGLVALGQAARQQMESRDYLCTEIARLRDKFEKGIIAGFPGATPFFQDQERLPNCTAIGFPGIVNEALLYALNRKRLFASIGGGSFQQIGLVLEASGIPKMLATSAINFSLSRETHEDEIDKGIEIVVETAKKLSRTSVKMRES